MSKKISLFLMTITIFLVSQFAFSAAVKKVIKRKRYIIIDTGTTDGYDVGAIVYFLNASGKKIAVGKIRKAKKSYSIVKIRRKYLKRIKVGMDVALKQKKSTEEGPSGISGTDHRTNIKFFYLASIMTPAVFNDLSYHAIEADQADNSAQTLWDKEIAKMSLMGFGGEFEFGIGSSFAVSAGFRYAVYVGSDFKYPKAVLTYYDMSDTNKYVETSESATAMGLYSDFTFLDIAFGSSFFWRTSVGLDIDMSTAIMASTQKDDKSSETHDIGSFNSKLTVASLRLGTNFNLLMLDSIGIIFGVNTLVPLGEFAKSSSIKSEDPNKQKLIGGDSQKDLETSLAHKKGSLGLQIALMMYYAF